LTAMRMSGCTLEEAQNNDDIRIPWKTANFALLYLASAETLHETYVAEGITRFSLKDCENIRRDWFKLYNGIRTYFDHCIAQARKDGGVRTPFGKWRMLPCIDLKGDGWPIGKLRDGDERKACNTPIQGGAFELIKRAEARIARMLSEEGDWFTPVLEIHDDLMFEFEAKWAEKVRERVQTAMTADSPFRGVPLETDWKQGPSWGELEKVKKEVIENKSPGRKQRT
jgi:DNA polymerase I